MPENLKIRKLMVARRSFTEALLTYLSETTKCEKDGQVYCPTNQKSTNNVALFLEKTNSVEKRKPSYTVGKLV